VKNGFTSSIMKNKIIWKWIFVAACSCCSWLWQ